MGSKISYGVLVLALLIAGLIFSSKNKATTQQISNNNLASSNKTLTVTPTKVKTDFDTESDDQVASVTPKVTSGVSSNIITPSKSLIPTATLIPTLTPMPTVTLIPTITPTATITPIQSQHQPNQIHRPPTVLHRFFWLNQFKCG